MEVQRIPVSGQMHDHVMTLTGIPASIFFHQAEPVVKAFAEVAEYYDMDSFGAATDAYNYEIEAMGGKLIYGEHAMPTIDFRDPLIKEPADLLKLRTPDFTKDGRLPYAMESVRLSADYSKGRRMGIMCGTFSMAVGMRGYPKLVRDMRRDPEFVRDLLTFIVDEVQIPYCLAQKKYANVDVVAGMDAWAMVPNLTIDQLHEWVAPFGERLQKKAAELGMMAGSGGGDYCEERIEKFDPAIMRECFKAQIKMLGRNSIFLGMGPWHELPLEPVVEFLEEHKSEGISISISLNARLLRDGPVSRIVETIKRFIDTFGHDYQLGMSFANIPADTASEHVHAAVAAIHTYGQKPIADDLDSIAFTPPQRESFAEWRKNREK